ncbi:hypothetical protein CCACVL1_02850 [Corchorus capsularis]|uniref:Uncharacterized protein n=1 Tax=Corchorus capsularis TaxID=210143 RepID=A0A1R3K571_COCAP|nr:hypothetical protein CCACVL1_02850 [Corchorus capsularis]
MERKALWFAKYEADSKQALMADRKARNNKCSE